MLHHSYSRDKGAVRELHATTIQISGGPNEAAPEGMIIDNSVRASGRRITWVGLPVHYRYVSFPHSRDVNLQYRIVLYQAGVAPARTKWLTFLTSSPYGNNRICSTSSVRWFRRCYPHRNGADKRDETPPIKPPVPPLYLFTRTLSP